MTLFPPGNGVKMHILSFIVNNNVEILLKVVSAAMLLSLCPRAINSSFCGFYTRRGGLIGMLKFRFPYKILEIFALRSTHRRQIKN